MKDPAVQFRVWLAAAALLVVFPLIAPAFWITQIAAQSFILGIIALSLVLLAGYGGMVSMAQLAVAGIAGYFAAYFGIHSGASLGVPLPWGLTILVGLAAGTIFGTLVGLIAVRCQGIYMMMITLAIAVGLFYLARQNLGFFNAYNGFHGVKAPVVLGLDMRQPLPFYYLCLACAGGLYAFVAHLVRTPFGLALQGIRDDARRMRTLGFDVERIRVLAFALAGFIAAVGGLLRLWYGGSISPGSINVGASITILIIAILGGMTRPIGAFAGALLFVLIQNFAIDFIDRERFNTMIGLILLAIILFLPNGAIGLAGSIEKRFRAAGGPAARRPQSAATPESRRHP
jgi:branched-chain amino acid transport system permease protein